MTETPTSGPSASGTTGPEQDRVRTEHLTDYTRLRRSRTDRKVAGVAGGLGRHLNIDPTIIRVVLVVLIFFGGAGLLLYAAAWVLVPEEGADQAMVDTSSSTRNALLIGAAVVAALLVLGDAWGSGFPWGLAWLFLVVAVLVIAFSDRDRPRPQAGQPVGQPVGPPPGAYPPPPAPAPAPAYGPAYAPATEPADTASGAPTPPPPAWYPPANVPAPVPPRTRGPRLFGFTVALVALTLGSLGLYEAAGGDVTTAAYPALATAVIGAMLVVGSFFGRPGGLIALGLLALVSTLVVGVGDPDFGGDRDQRAVPVVAAAVNDYYQVPAGRIELDLREVADPEDLDGRVIELEATVGELVVILPDDVAANVRADIDLGGSISLPGVQRDGWNVSLYDEMPGDDPVAEVDLVLQLRAGGIEVQQ